MSDVYDDDLFDEAKNEFPAKEDLKDRLVVIYPNGKTGQRMGNNGKPYDWYETTTVVLDDGPDGTSVTDLVGPAPQVLEAFQWSTKGIASRLAPKLSDPKVGSLFGRINTIKNKTKGMADPWNIAPPTDEDKATARRHVAVAAAARKAIRDQRQATEDQAAF